jgi:hypothetical protein
MRPTVLTDEKPIIKNQPTFMLIEMESGLTHLTYFFRNTNSSETTSNGIILLHIFIEFIYKTLLDEKKKRGERDGMNRIRKCGRNASINGWHVPRSSSQLIQERHSFFIYLGKRSLKVFTGMV